MVGKYQYMLFAVKDTEQRTTSSCIVILQEQFLCLFLEAVDQWQDIMSLILRFQVGLKGSIPTLSWMISGLSIFSGFLGIWKKKRSWCVFDNKKPNTINKIRKIQVLYHHISQCRNPNYGISQTSTRNTNLIPPSNLLFLQVAMLPLNWILKTLALD